MSNALESFITVFGLVGKKRSVILILPLLDLVQEISWNHVLKDNNKLHLYSASQCSMGFTSQNQACKCAVNAGISGNYVLPAFFFFLKENVTKNVMY